MTATLRRENIPVTAQEASLLEELTHTDSPARKALAELCGGLGTSRATVSHAVLTLGMKAVREKIQEIGYAHLAASYTDQERAEQRSITASRRRRSAERGGG